MLLIFAFFVALVDAQPATFVLHFGCSFPNNGTHIIGTSVSVCGALPTYIQTVAPVGSCMIGQEFLVYLNTSSLIGLSDCSVVVSENQVSVSRAFQILPGETYEWMDLTADLTINIEDWNPWCAVSPDTDPTASFNGGRVTLLGGNTVFRGYSPFRAMCTFLSDLRWDLFPHLANGYAFGDTLNPDLCTSAGSFHRPVVVGVLRTTDPITVVVHEFKFTGPNPDPCLDSRVFTIGKSAIGFPTSDISGGFVQYSQDTNCGDGSCDSGLLISRLQVESRCWDPSDPIIGIPQGAQNAYNETLPDGSVAGRSFPTGALLINWDHPDGSQRNYRFESIAAESNSVYFIIAADNYQIYTQYDTVPNSSPLAYKSYNSSVDYNSAVSARFIKQPTANCGYGSCEAKPITSTLHIDTQGLCDEMESVSIYQPQFNGNGVSFAVQNYHPNCMQLFANSKLLFCVWNLNPTQVVVNYKTLGSAQLPMINCQTTSQRCDVTASLPPFCASQSDGTPCNDENNCTLNDTCLGGVCVGSNPIVCSFPVDQCHYVGVCNPSTGLCVASAKPDGDQCNDDNVCTDSDSCQNGVCVGTPAPGRACQQSSVAGSCVTGSTCSSGGVCGGGSFHPFGTPCDDTDLCSNSDQCSSSGVCSGTPATCVNCLPPYKCSCGECICPSNTWIQHRIRFSSVTEDNLAFQGEVFGCSNNGGGSCSAGGFITVTRNGVIIASNIPLQLTPGCRVGNSRTVSFNDVIYDPIPFTFPGNITGPFLFCDTDGLLFGAAGPVRIHLYACASCAPSTPYRVDMTLFGPSKKRDTTSTFFGTASIETISSLTGSE